MGETGQIIPLQSVLLKQQIRRVIHQFPGGPVEGYEWRLLLEYPPTDSAGPRAEWTPWVFGSRQVVEQMLDQWEEYMAARSMPKKPAH